MLIMIDNNITYKLGRNAQENFLLIDEALFINENYWWFHLDGIPSGHCIIFSEDINKEMIQYAGTLVKQYSKLKDNKDCKKNKKAKIVYTQIKNVAKTKTVGQVLLTGLTNTISI